RGEYSSARVWLTGLSGGKPPHKKCPYSLKNVEPHYEECESISYRENRRLWKASWKAITHTALGTQDHLLFEIDTDARHRYWLVCQPLCLWTGSVKGIISAFETLPVRQRVKEHFGFL